MRYNETLCPESKLIPSVWFVASPNRQTMARHLKALRQAYNRQTAYECKRRLLWIGISPQNRKSSQMTEKQLRAMFHRVEKTGNLTGDLGSWRVTICPMKDSEGEPIPDRLRIVAYGIGGEKREVGDYGSEEECLRFINNGGVGNIIWEVENEN